MDLQHRTESHPLHYCSQIRLSNCTTLLSLWTHQATNSGSLTTLAPGRWTWNGGVPVAVNPLRCFRQLAAGTNRSSLSCQRIPNEAGVSDLLGPHRS